MKTNESQIADSLLRQEITKRLITGIDGCKIYAVNSEWAIDNVKKTAASAGDLQQFEQAFKRTENASIFVPKLSGLSIEDIKPVIKSNSQHKTIFIEQ